MPAAGLRRDLRDGPFPNVGEHGPPCGIVFGKDPKIGLDSILRTDLVSGPFGNLDFLKFEFGKSFENLVLEFWEIVWFEEIWFGLRKNRSGQPLKSSA